VIKEQGLHILQYAIAIVPHRCIASGKPRGKAFTFCDMRLRSHRIAASQFNISADIMHCDCDIAMQCGPSIVRTDRRPTSYRCIASGKPRGKTFTFCDMRLRSHHSAASQFNFSVDSMHCDCDIAIQCGPSIAREDRWPTLHRYIASVKPKGALVPCDAIRLGPNIIHFSCI